MPRHPVAATTTSNQNGNLPTATPRRLLRTLTRVSSTRENDDKTGDVPAVTRAPRVQDTSRTLLKTLAKASSPPGSPPPSEADTIAPLPAPDNRQRGRPTTLQLDLGNNPFLPDDDAAAALRTSTVHKRDGNASPRRRGSLSPVEEDYPADLPYAPESPQTPNLPSIAEESENEEVPEERPFRSTTSHFLPTRRLSNPRRPEGSPPRAASGDNSAVTSNDRMYHAMHRVLKNVQGTVREIRDVETGEVSFRSRPDGGSDDKDRRRDLMEEVERMRREVEASNRDLMSLRQQLDERARAEDEVDRRLGEATARVQGLREQVRERNEVKRRGSRGSNPEDDFDELDEDDDEEGELISSLSRTTRGVSLTRKWGTATMLLLLFLVVEMLVLWVIVGLAQTKYTLFLHYAFPDSTNDNGNGSDAMQHVAGEVWFIEWARQRILVWLDKSWGRGTAPV
ncbi:hypothetical protein BC937DRAFT_92966 [Endogone sp. FLAS-F59071]|nr:hypothetical protein BC937DRAFT_92966 [Endogone sp. FLAS-F59071]|eukprot:RUS15050.1 hypothetical protein BC937DRAFT_92966 [Endogone sp. FLAS-F59071]